MLLIALSLLFSSASALLNAMHKSLADASANATYDYVIVGCGIAGLVLTMRLSEASNVTVLCIEAGPL